MGSGITQKTGKSKRGQWTAKQRQYVDRCVADGCVACRRAFGHKGVPAQWHHEKERFHGAGMRAPHEFGLPLCDQCHTIAPFSLHRNRVKFEWHIGCTEAELVDLMQIEYDWK